MTANPMTDLTPDQSNAVSEAFYSLLVIFIGAVIIASCAIIYAHRVKAEMLSPAVEIPLPEQPDFDAAWEGIPTPPFNQGDKP